MPAPGGRILTVSPVRDHLRSVTTLRSMKSDYDPRREAEAALKLAMAADGPERQRLIGLAIAWQQLALMHPASTPNGRKEQAA